MCLCKTVCKSFVRYCQWLPRSREHNYSQNDENAHLSVEEEVVCPLHRLEQPFVRYFAHRSLPVRQREHSLVPEHCKYPATKINRHKMDISPLNTSRENASCGSDLFPEVLVR